MMNAYADEKYHACRYGELLEEAARARLERAAEEPHQGRVKRVGDLRVGPVWRSLRALFGKRVAVDRAAAPRSATFPGAAKLAREGH
jgi:hypothetical protein